jgi:hypothetical protein
VSVDEHIKRVLSALDEIERLRAEIIELETAMALIKAARNIARMSLAATGDDSRSYVH